MKPVELIVTNSFHALVEQLRACPGPLTPARVRQEFSDAIARDILCSVAKQAGLRHVLAALAAAGAPATLDEISDRFQAAHDCQVSEAKL